MLDELQSPAGESAMASQAAAPGQPMPPAQREFGGDSKLAGILAKKSRGEKLTRAEAGYLGGVQRKERPAKAPEAGQNILLEVPANPDNVLFDQSPKSEMASGGMACPAPDSALIRKTADALLSSGDFITKQFVAYEAKQAGADAQTCEAYETAVALKPRNRELMVENSEPVVLGLCKFFGCSPEKLNDYIKNSGFIAGALAHGFGVVAAVKSIRESKRELQGKTETKA